MNPIEDRPEEVPAPEAIREEQRGGRRRGGRGGLRPHYEEEPAPAAPAARARGRRTRSPQNDVEPATPRRGLRRLLIALRALRAGDFSIRLPENTGDLLLDEIGGTVNDVARLLESLSDEIGRVSVVVSLEGQLSDRIELMDVAGRWQATAGSVNALVSNFAAVTQEVVRVLESAARGEDLTQQVALVPEGQPLRGEFLRLDTALNEVLDQISTRAPADAEFSGWTRQSTTPRVQRSDPAAEGARVRIVEGLRRVCMAQAASAGVSFTTEVVVDLFEVLDQLEIPENGTEEVVLTAQIALARIVHTAGVLARVQGSEIITSAIWGGVRKALCPFPPIFQPPC